MIILSIALLLIGFVLLIQGANWFVESASTIAKKFHIPTIIIGMTIVAFGTSAPELAVSTTAALKGSNNIAVGNVLGSNLFNLLVVIGCCSLIKNLPVKKSVIKKDYPFYLLISSVFILLSFDRLLFHKTNMLSRLDGFILIIFLIIFMFKTIKEARSHQSSKDKIEENIGYSSILKSILFLLIGLGCIVGGGQLVVDHASIIASIIGISDTLIGLTIVAIGTSLPELVTSIVATKKGEIDMAVGNVIGSNILNILMILGISSVIHPILISSNSIYDMGILLIINLIIYILILPKHTFYKFHGFLLLAIYFGYTAYIIIR